MDNDRLTLRAIAQRASDRHGGARGRALGRVADKAGLTLTYTTFDRILAGTYTSTPSKNTLEALAKLAGMHPRVVYAAAGLPEPMGSLAEQLPPDADLLDGPQRDAVIAVVRQFVAAQKALHNLEELMEHADRSAPNQVPEVGPAQQPTGLSVVPPSVGDAVAADQDEDPGLAAGEAEEPDTP